MSLSGSDHTKKMAAIGMAHTIISHHGIHDWLDDNCDDYFDKRISKGDGYEEILGDLSEVLKDTDINTLFEKAANEWFDAAKKIRTFSKTKEDKIDNTKFYFYLGMLERLIQSALIDADRTDTADFMSGRETDISANKHELWENTDKLINKKLSEFAEIPRIIQ